ncbi:MAG TPA: pro-sigmaK processing inhibitor BofA family protein [Clostridia bacterium]|nr:pro-sigmaK processing inhibitor BofA family protein [Clostridia bacterium]
MMIDYGVVLAYIVGILLLFVLGRLLVVPLKVLLKLAFNALAGAAVILFVNWAGSFFGFHLALNIYSAFIVGTLGIPGFILLVILKFIFG